MAEQKPFFRIAGRRLHRTLGAQLSGLATSPRKELTILQSRDYFFRKDEVELLRRNYKILCSPAPYLITSGSAAGATNTGS
jgi:hypothetical protein